MNYNKDKLDGFLEKINKMSINKIRKTYKVLGEGSSRIVVQYTSSICLKISKGRLGYIQNQVEWDIYNSYQNPKFLSKIYDAFFNYEHLKVLVCKFYPKRVYNISQINKNKSLVKFRLELAKNHNFRTNNIKNEVYGDLQRPSSYRFTKTNKPILVDFRYNMNAVKKWASIL